MKALNFTTGSKVILKVMYFKWDIFPGWHIILKLAMEICNKL